MSRSALAWAALGVAALLPFFATPYQLTLLSFVYLYALVALGLVLLTGVAGLISFGQAAFVGIGAYATAYLSVAHQWGGLATLAAVVAISIASAAGIGRLTLSMGGHYLSLATLAWGICVYYALGQIPALGGFNGLGGIPPLVLGGVSFADAKAMYGLILACLALGMLAVRNLLDSRPGRAIRALRSGAALPEAFGANTLHLKSAAFVVAGVLAGISGWLHASMQRFVNPTPFSLHMGIEYLFMAVIGGAGSIFGAVTGAAVVTLLKQQLQDVLPRLLGQTGNFEIVVFGALMLFVLARATGGIWPFVARFLPAAAPPMDTRAQPAPLAEGRHDDAAAAGADVPLLSVKDAVKRFGGLTAVDRVSFDVRQGEILALLGPNGAGKSTMFHLVSGLLSPTEGEVRLRGRRIDGLPSRAIAGLGLARTFQHVKLAGGMSALENAAMGCHLRGHSGVLRSMLRMNRAEEAAIRDEAMRQLRRCGLADQADVPAGNLALGKQRILEVARALCADPALLLLDEPAAGLRHAEKDELAALLRQLRGEGITVLIVDHDMDFIMKIADRLVVMRFGSKIADGDPVHVRRDPIVREAYLGL
jgi:branched-chain amino acid transport system permease protein